MRHQCNDNASMMILNNINPYDSVELGKCFDNKKVNIIS